MYYFFLGLTASLKTSLKVEITTPAPNQKQKLNNGNSNLSQSSRLGLMINMDIFHY
jgi:hypothetical protein